MINGKMEFVLDFRDSIAIDKQGNIKRTFMCSYPDRDMSQLLLLGKFEYGGGPIFKVVLEC